MEVIRLNIDELTPDPNNAKEHPAWQVEQIKASIETFGNLDPIGVWGEKNLIVEGHGRYLALKELGYNEVEAIRLDWLSEDERKAYALAHNKLTMNSGFDADALKINLDEIGTIDMDLFGFKSGDWFTDRERDDREGQEGNDEYNEFLDKFEQKKTSDDCYTPDNIYEVVAEYVEKRYKFDRSDFVRPFYPGGDYQGQKYKKTDKVVDNPPFSIMAEIVDFYIEKGVKFFLFAPGLAALNYTNREQVTAVCTYEGITYENGADVTTSFITNMEGTEIMAMTAPELSAKLKKTNEENERKFRKQYPRYEYPDEVITGARLGYFSVYGQDFKIRRDAAMFIRALDVQKEQGGGIYGGALLLSTGTTTERKKVEKAAIKKAEEEKAAAEVVINQKWELSQRERELVKGLGDTHGNN